MIKQIKQQQGNVSDSCTECGSYVDIGAVVEADDTLLILSFTGDDSLIQAKTLQQIAQQRFSDTKTEVIDDVNTITLKLNFAFSVEKMIFQLENQL
ncbi:DUF406 family protein [Shewanella frigidimarina]|uniref:DUF406 family protein n=1 Tax=Shewanella frigidimarina TaxID=56812 RepID=A0A106BZ29_SHEFR|nr:DUF406 family protein [Shewanella frigidimarina]KVX01263.1 hypothetical protein AWJ07_18730 [Shewanella frigidimarina]